jgi:hypothetical protein
MHDIKWFSLSQGQRHTCNNLIQLKMAKMYVMMHIKSNEYMLTPYMVVHFQDA